MDPASTMAADTNPIENGNGPHMNGNSEFTLDQLERELPFVANDQVYLGDLLGRVMQTIYAELSELAETCVLNLVAVEHMFKMPSSLECQTCPIARGNALLQTGWLKLRSR